MLLWLSVGSAGAPVVFVAKQSTRVYPQPGLSVSSSQTRTLLSHCIDGFFRLGKGMRSRVC